MDILRQLEEVSRQYKVALCKFNLAEDPEDIDVAIAELNALEVKRNRLYQIAKKEGVEIIGIKKAI